MAAVGQPWIAPDTPADRPRSLPRSTASTQRARPDSPLRGSPLERLQPRGIGSILDAGFEVLRFRFPLIASITITLVAPLMGLPLLLRLTRIGDRVDDVSDVRINLGVGPETGGQTVAWVVERLGAAVALALLGIAIGYLLGAWLRGDDPGYGAVMRVVGRRGPVALAAWLLALIPKLAGLVVCGVGAIFTVAMFVIISPAVANEAIGPAAAVARSWRLSSGRRTTTMMGLVVCGFGVALLLGVISTLAGSVVKQSLPGEPTWGWAVVTGIQIAGALVLLPVQAAWASLAYLDLRVRAEGLDIVVESERIFPTEGANGAR